MKIESFILTIIKKIESLKEGVIAYAYKTGNTPMTNVWWEISVSDFDLYSSDERFRKLTDAWHKAARAKGEKIIFVCGWRPSEKRLAELLEKDNLILNV